MSISRVRAAAVLFAVSVAPFAMAEEPVNSVKMERYGVITNGVFSANGEQSQHFQDMQRRLSDPKERAKMVAETRVQLAGQYPDFIAELGTDQARADKFFDL